ncbi:AAA domain-containing protein [Chlorobium sp. KB01]|uniref:AAA domain-containing protein n=1 Tax=Chlorobium sp. KB01 TaxID=1917528 RepID=UPI0009F9B5B5
MKSSNGRNPDVLAYFQELAETSPLRTNDDKSMIAMKYRHLDKVSGSSILSSFLQARPLSPGMVSSDLIFPFGCNMSQKMAVQRAIQHPVSLVQGPPGTGKTQTILNLINIRRDPERCSVSKITLRLYLSKAPVRCVSRGEPVQGSCRRFGGRSK